MRTIDSPCSTMTVYAHDLTGMSWLVRPPARDDQEPWRGLPSLHVAAEAAFLSSLGWCEPPSEYDEDEERDGYTPDGREVVGLYGLPSIIDDPCIEQIAEAVQEFRALVRLVARLPEQRTSGSQGADLEDAAG